MSTNGIKEAMDSAAKSVGVQTAEEKDPALAEIKISFNQRTGEIKWEYPQNKVTALGMMVLTFKALLFPGNEAAPQIAKADPSLLQKLGLRK